ncbi:hypothetical protein LI82_10135 [Methanococcoides methylutens]|uniref:Glycosyl transferase family 1 domain-containing protein n=1 Tax=Methanococcoides methylutens TaxID=2226 RepID=A0A099T1S9_METMT|nr:glycosyltransferase family 4 protein [Methanococcoides methylutens]KGK98088.1 hypothetical protein LI82_10135 [Methanococcoides methylutens]
MKIVFICQSASHSKTRPFGRGGTDSQIYGLSSKMAMQGHDIYVLGKFNGDDWKDDGILTDHIKFINIKSPYLKDAIIGETFSALLLSYQMRKAIKKNKPDVLVLSSRFTAYFPSKLKIPKIFVTHNPDAMEFFKNFSVESHWFNNIYYYFKKYIEERVMHNSNMIVALNKDIQNYLNENGHSNVCIIPNAIDVNKYKNETDKNFILYAGGFRKVKGLECLLEAFLNLWQNYNTDLVLIGSGPEEEKLKNIVHSKGIEDRVHFLPLVSNSKLREYLSKCSIFVLPSFFETFGIVTIEAMASSKPIIATNIPGPQDIITHGFDGFLFEKGNVDDLTKYMDLCISNKNIREEIGVNAKYTVETSYTFDIISTKYIEMCKLLIMNMEKYRGNS